ncbi:MAG: squalene--hopene cyclase [Gammaproteobacteria bacterium]|nr:squalene--hopene cyclase [Gammaproteobacteria bacterium]
MNRDTAIQPELTEKHLFNRSAQVKPQADRTRVAYKGNGHDSLDKGIERAHSALLEQQHEDGYWCFELEADCTIPSEYVLMMHFMDEVDETLQKKIGVYLRSKQAEHGGWSLYPGGDLDISGSVKIYYALKLIGDSPTEPHMAKARDAILARGGAARSNVFTRFLLAMFEQVPWRAVPFVPTEIVLLPKWFPFHLSKVSYWSRTVMVPLSILCTLRAKAKNPRRIGVPELFSVPAEEERNYFPIRSKLNRVILALERLGRTLERFTPKKVREKSLKQAEQWTLERLNGSDGIGGIFPAMVNAYEALTLLGYSKDDLRIKNCQSALHNLLVEQEDWAYCQPCQSPAWDTPLTCLTLHETNAGRPTNSTINALTWMQGRQILDEPGDWRAARPELKGGGWAFQFRNSHYPDLDDTAIAAWAMCQTGDPRFQESIRRAADWICGMQSSNGGFAAFDVDNCYYYLNEIPFADHGALLDPPTADVSARCLALLALVDPTGYRDACQRCLQYLKNQQEDNGSWFGRWGTNYIYGTWSVLSGLEVAGEDSRQPYIQSARAWLLSVQRSDGGWGEGNDTYFLPEKAGDGPTSTSFQTAWAMLGLMASGLRDHQALATGNQYLLRMQGADGLWHDTEFTSPGFPRVFYLRYHGYHKYFPLWALARYRNCLAR